MPLSLKTTLSLLFPDRCAGCGKVGTLFCPDCLVELKSLSCPLCPGCLKPNANRRAHPGCQARDVPNFLFTPFVYQGMVRRLIKKAKFGRDQRIVALLASLLLEEIEEDEELYTFLSQSRPLVIPIPLGERRLRDRGFNQAATLASRIAQRFGLALSEKALVKQYDTLPQSLLSSAKRKQNVHHSFFTCPGKLEGYREVLLVDDVVTTGATLKAATYTLRKAGIKEVWAVVLAH